MRRTTIEEYGYNFIPSQYMKEGRDEYYYRNQQIESWQATWRKLSLAEIEQLESQGNSSGNWGDVLVEDPIDLTLIRNNAFYGLVRIGSMQRYTLGYHDFTLPEGIRDSHIVSCDIGRHCSIHRVAYLSHYIIDPMVILNEIDEMGSSNHAKFGNGILKEGEEEKVRITINMINEAENRPVLPFEEMIAADAYLWSIYRDYPLFLERLKEFTNATVDFNRGWYSSVGSYSVIKACRIIKDVKFGSHVYVKGANKLKNLTIRSNEDSPSQIGEGVELVNGIIGYGCRVFYGVKAVRFIMGNNSNLKYGARLLNSLLGDNSTISCCEVLNALVFPFHEQHHNNSFLIASLVQGQSNMAAGATIGSNHNTRSNDGEMHAKRGFWPALSSSIKFNSRFASFTLVTKGYYPNELDISLPFAMVAYAEDIKRVTIMPAYWWLYNRYALERNSHKFLSRDKRKVISQKIETNYIAPDTIEEIFVAMENLALWVGKAALEAALIAPSIAANTEAIKEQGHLLLETHPDQVEALKVYAPNLERSETDAVVQKVAQGYRAYSEMLLYGSVSIILNYLDKYESDFFTFQKEALSFIQAHPLNKVAVSGPFINLGGLPVSEPLILHLITQVQENKINSWAEIHHQYDIWWQQYDKVKAIVALQALQKRAKVANLEKDHWTYLIEKFIFLCDQNALEVYKTRKKDFEDPFRKMVYRNIREMEEVLGKPEENEFVLTIKNEMNKLKSLARRFAP